MKKLLSLFIVMAVVLAGAGMAFAFGSYLTDPVTGFDAVYPGAGAISTCSLCHNNPAGGGARNPFGSDYESAVIAGHTDHVFDAALEALDSDGDGFSNGTEILATPSTYPGDPASFPTVPLDVTSPNGGETVLSGSTTAITYTAPANVASVKVKFSLSGPLGPWFPAIDAGGSTIGSFNWTVPTPKKNKTKALVKVIGFTGLNGTGARVDADRSDAVFTIETVTITAPAAGAPVSAPSQVITWTTNGTKAVVDRFVLFYSINNGTTWKKIFASPAAAGNPGTYTWDGNSLRPIPTPLNPKPNSRIKLLLKDSTGATVAIAVSSKFTIQ